ncbi:MAG: hypothetical protein AAF216_12510 [Pseudomonadota bacterium]
MKTVISILVAATLCAGNALADAPLSGDTFGEVTPKNHAEAVSKASLKSELVHDDEGWGIPTPCINDPEACSYGQSFGFHDPYFDPSSFNQSCMANDCLTREYDLSDTGMLYDPYTGDQDPAYEAFMDAIWND